MKSQLNLGCGYDIRPAWVNLDVAALPGVDVVHDLDVLPYPFQDEKFDIVLARHVLEHVNDLIATMREIHRILRPGGMLQAIVPHFTSKDAFSDPTHRRTFSVNSFAYFVGASHRAYYFDFGFSKLAARSIVFQKRIAYPWNYLLERFVNSSHRLQNLYEGSPLRMFPAYELEVRLIK